MIRHCVFVRFRSDVPATERTAIHADLEALRQVIDGMIEASQTRSPSMPRTRRSGPTTASSSTPIRQVPTPW